MATVPIFTYSLKTFALLNWHPQRKKKNKIPAKRIDIIIIIKFLPPLFPYINEKAGECNKYEVTKVRH